MFEIRACHPEHIRLVLVQEPQKVDHALMIGSGSEHIAAGGLSFSGWIDKVTCVCCAGVVEKWPGTGYAWAIFSPKAGPHMLAITRFARRIVDAAPFNRIETCCLVDFSPAHRWLERCGFALELPIARKYDPAGRDCSLYSKVR